MLRLSLAFPASIAEDLSPIEAIRRTSLLTRNAKGRIFVVMFIVYAACYALEIVSMFLAIALGSLSALAGSLMHIPLRSPIGYMAIGLTVLVYCAFMLAWTSLSWASYTTAQSVLYRDQCLRIDGIALPAAL